MKKKSAKKAETVLRYKDGTVVKRGDIVAPDYECVVVDLFTDESGIKNGLLYWIPIMSSGSRSPLNYVFTTEENATYKENAGGEGGGHCRTGNLSTVGEEWFAINNKAKKAK